MLLLLVIVVTRKLPAQVINNDIENRIELSTDGKPRTSNTSECTVQWDCVDQSLTGKCIQYHNDQWFFFNSETKAKLYVNITNQNCRDDRGVQVVILQGTPCEPLTYETKACVSLASQDDVFIRLDSLSPDEPYLINIDGYLNDFCEFQIDIAEKPKGIPAQLSDHAVNFELKQVENKVGISWTNKGEIDKGFYLYEVYRRRSDRHKSTLIATVAHERNAYGVSKSDYFYQDTLKTNGTYHYKVVGISSEENSYLLGENKVSMAQDKLANEWVTVALDFENNTPLRVLLLDRLTQKILLRQDLTFKTENNELNLLVVPYVKLGVTTFEVVVVDMKTGERKIYFFDNE